MVDKETNLHMEIVSIKQKKNRKQGTRIDEMCLGISWDSALGYTTARASTRKGKEGRPRSSSLMLMIILVSVSAAQ